MWSIIFLTAFGRKKLLDVTGDIMAKKSIFKDVLWYFFCMVTVAQILFMMCFFIKQFGNVTLYASTTEFLEIAQTLQTDEYMGILYPLLIRGAMYLEHIMVISYYQIVYIIQTAVSIMAAGFFLGSYFDFSQKKGSFYISLSYFISIPMLAAMYTRLQPVTLQLALWLCLFGGAKSIWNSSKKIPYSIGMLSGSVALVLLVPNDRYALLLFWAGLAAAALIKKSGQKRVLVMSGLCIFCMALSICFLQSGNGRGRMERNLSSAWFLECTSPHFAKDYVCWPEEVREVVSLEDAIGMVRREDGLLKGIDQKLTDVYGRKQTNAFYRRMGNTAFRMHTKETVYSFKDDVLQGIFTPFSIMNHKNSGYNSKDGYWYSDFPKALGKAGKYLYFGSIIGLGMLLLIKLIECAVTIGKSKKGMLKEKKFPLKAVCMIAFVGIVQVAVSAFLDVGAMDYGHYPVMIFLWYFIAIVV